MKEERKPVVVLVDTNPVVVNLSNEVRNIKHIQLVYFKLMKIDIETLAAIPNLYLRVSETHNVNNNQIIPSNNISLVAASGYARLRQDTVPLHYELVQPFYIPGAPPVPTTLLTLQGKQPKGMRWSAHNISGLSNFQVTLVGFNGEPYPFSTVTGTTMELVFDVEWADTVNQSQTWKTDHIYMNSMNS